MNTNDKGFVRLPLECYERIWKSIRNERIDRTGKIIGYQFPCEWHRIGRLKSMVKPMERAGKGRISGRSDLN